MGIPKKEFIRVMQDILNSSNSTTEDEKRNLKPEEIIKNTPRSMAVKKLNEIIDEQQSWKNGKKAANKKDSFYFLQSTWSLRGHVACPRYCRNHFYWGAFRMHFSIFFYGSIIQDLVMYSSNSRYRATAEL
jgi:hypothetical protein